MSELVIQYVGCQCSQVSMSCKISSWLLNYPDENANCKTVLYFLSIFSSPHLKFKLSNMFLLLQSLLRVALVMLV